MHRHGAATKEQPKRTAKKDVSDSDKYADLLVFGYACKVFRDDERALFHEQGKHLIPWMGEKNIMIDRYDGRGHLHDLSEYDSGSWNTSYQLSEEEARIEALCDEERYLAMHTDLLEEEARQEEEYKRLSEALADEGSYNAVAFKYSADYYDPSQPTEEEDANREAEEEAEQEETEEPFIAPPGLTIPPDVELPATTKTHAIIERTASFVSQQGAQFEIVLKAKQSGNSQFDFLRFDHYLNPYYKHILRAMKEGRYNTPSDGKQEQSQESQSDDSDEDGDGSYLHPSLFAPKKCSRLEELMKPLQVMDPDHPLAELVRKAKQERNGSALVTKPGETVEPTASSVPTQYPADSSAAAVYYGYYMLPDGTYCMAPPPPGVEASSYYNSHTTTGVMAPPSPAALPPGTSPTPPPDSFAMATQATDPSQVAISAPPAITPESSSRPQAPASMPTAAAIIPPPPDIQPVIDKLAEYVARNGVKFEASVLAKNDPRFDFLHSWHQYNTYYEFKKNYFMQKEGITPIESETADYTAGEDQAAKEAKQTKAPFAPICFAIKAKENDMLPLERNRVRLDDDSDEDKLLEEAGLEAVVGGTEMIDKEPPQLPGAEEKRPTLSLEELEAKQAKQRLEDRLAAAAREKLAQASKESKEKQLQAERKRKAALFLQTLRCPLAGEPEAKKADLPPPPQPEVQEALTVLCGPPPPKMSSTPAAYPPDQKPPTESQVHRSREAPSSSSSSYAPSRGTGRDRHKGREKEKKKKKHKRTSRSRSRSKSQHASLPSAYRRARRSRSRSRSQGRRDRRGPSSDRRFDERERGKERYRRGNSSGRPRGHSRSRSPRDKKKTSSSSSGKRRKTGSSLSTASSPTRAFSPSASPASSLDRSRSASQDKDKAVSSSIASSVQSKITQDLMVKVRAMLAASKTFNPPTS
ncbi:splicing factor, suppressor of white-apricot homolog isoform X2 [Lampris incognitus]|uniref:splicing factor, suppressor of white-apricot homolog isoform X2 n=1 Tax=Lampris incognitus TaxID=2546036 RepID=UPI0024B57002|nr:splicing factor, suppressor of white-apricot homolog isoform X2 [Lampris incognitus]